MRHRLSTIGIPVLVMIIVAAGMSGCARQAEEREAEATQEVSSGGTAVSSGGEVVAPGETIVSAVTVGPSTPGSAVEPTYEVSEGTPAPAQPEATTEPGAAATAAPAQPPASSGEQGYVEHTVQRGETLSSIARKYGTSWSAIAQANNLANPSVIVVGQTLKIPTSDSSSGSSSGGTSSGSSSGTSSGSTTGCRVKHTVQRGEWVWQIARNYGVSPYDILTVNGMSVASGRVIHPGTVLCIP
jgi:LysM repeat protein